ncbi:RDD family protein [Nocardiopsis aegyptia]|uniref:RDD family protein n=1 Tax=Nocardiopsis aegyptia TaxID=220378 RepID=UPI00366C4C2F
MSTGENRPDPGDPRSGTREQHPAPPPPRSHTEGRPTADPGSAPKQREPGRHEVPLGRQGEAAPVPPPTGAAAVERRTTPGDVNVVWRRIAQYIIDSVISGIGAALAFAVAVPLAAAPGPEGSLAQPWLATIAYTAFTVLAVAIFLAYWVLVPVMSVKGQTLGMMLMGIRVVRGDGTRVSAARHLVRVLLFIVDGILSGLVGLLVILGTERNQRVGDLVADTLVVRTRD